MAASAAAFGASDGTSAIKVLFYQLKPLSPTHGGLQTQILQTRDALGRAGVQTDFLRGWDGDQTGDLLLFFARVPTPLLRLAQQKGMKVVLSDLLIWGSNAARRANIVPPHCRFTGCGRFNGYLKVRGTG